MLVLMHLDWEGTPERLKERDEAVRKACEKTEGARFLGRHMPWTKKYHWTQVVEVKDIVTWNAMQQNIEWEREYKEVTHGEMEIYDLAQ